MCPANDLPHPEVCGAGGDPQSKDHPFQAKATAEFAKLRRLQAELENETGQVALLPPPSPPAATARATLLCHTSVRLLRTLRCRRDHLRVSVV